MDSILQTSDRTKERCVPGARAALLFALSVGLCAVHAADAADKVVMVDGTMLRGRVTAQTADSVSVQTFQGMSMTIPIARVRSVTTSAGVKVYNQENPVAQDGAARGSSSRTRRAKSSAEGEARGNNRIDLPNPIPNVLGIKPTAVTLVDGRKVIGHLACELNTHLVLYSPGFGTLASFRREFVADYLKDGKTVKVSRPRTLTLEEANIDLAWTGWPDTEPDKGPKPAYTTQKWDPPKRLLVWTKLTGQPKMGEALISGQNKVTLTRAKADDPDGWLVLGTPLDGKWDAETDVIVPGVGADRIYNIQGPASTYRHLSAENHGWISLKSMKVAGNLWIHERGRCNVNAVAPAEFVGAAHTFARNDRPPLFGRCKGKANFHTDDPEMTALTWDSRSYRLCQYLFIKKDKGASVEFIGSFTSGDKFWTFSGTTIIGPDSSVHADTRSGDHVYKDGTLQLMSGAHWHKYNNKMSGADFEIDGTVEFGTKERPLTKDVVVELSWKDYTDLNHKDKNHKPDWEPCGFAVFKQGKARMCSADPKTARVVFRYLDRDSGPGWCDTGRCNNNPGPYYRELPRRIDVLFLGDVVLDGVHFEDVHKGGVRLGNAAMRKGLRNVTFGRNCGGKPEEMYSIYIPRTGPAGWTEDPVVKKATAERQTQ